MGTLKCLIFFTVVLHPWGIHGITVNMSRTWFLPRLKFPVFYRYFADKATWERANAICRSHNGKLVSIHDEEEMDVLKSYVKQIDTLGWVWLGLKKEVQSKSFRWINGEQIIGDGYWLQPVPLSSTSLCVVIDPVADFRWHSFHCSGPETAAFICEIDVPEWAQKEDGCLIDEIPALSITLEPEIGIIELTSDCGPAGTRKIVCKGHANRLEIVKQLSCNEDPFSGMSVTDRSKGITNSRTTLTTSNQNMITTHGWTPTVKQTRH